MTCLSAPLMGSVCSVHPDALTLKAAEMAMARVVAKP